jgi:hypothetical protein
MTFMNKPGRKVGVALTVLVAAMIGGGTSLSATEQAAPASVDVSKLSKDEIETLIYDTLSPGWTPKASYQASILRSGPMTRNSGRAVRIGGDLLAQGLVARVLAPDLGPAEEDALVAGAGRRDHRRDGWPFSDRW